MADDIQVWRLAHELGRSYGEVGVLCSRLGIKVESPSDLLPREIAEKVRSAVASGRPQQIGRAEAKPVRSSRPAGGGGLNFGAGAASNSLISLTADLELTRQELHVLAERVGVRPIDFPRPLDPIGRARADREIGRLPNTVGRWSDRGFTTADALRWKQADIFSATEAESWSQIGFTPGAASSWRAKGVQGARLAAALRDAGVSVGDLGQFVSAGIAVVDAARWLLSAVSANQPLPERVRWASLGFRPDEAVAWWEAGVDAADATALRSLGVPATWAKSVSRARLPIGRAVEMLIRGIPIDEVPTWLRAGMEPTEAWGWISRGFDAAAAVSWQRAGVGNATTASNWCVRAFRLPSEAAAWLKEGLLDPDSAEMWRRLRFDPREARAWCDAGVVDAEEAAVWRSSFGHHEVSKPWRDVGFTAAGAAEWHRSGFSVGAATRWWQAGVYSPEDAGTLDARYEPALVKSLLASGLSTEDLRTWADRSIRPELLEMMLAQLGDGRAAAAEWRRALVPVAEWPDWMNWSPDSPRRASAWIAAGLHHSTVRERAEELGLDSITLGDALAAGRCEAELLAQLDPARSASFQLGATSFREWLADGSVWLEPARAVEVGGQELLHDLFRRSRAWAAPGSSLFAEYGDFRGDRWRRELVGNAHAVLGSLRLAPTWPIIYDSDEVTIDLTIEDNAGLAWVGRLGRGVAVSFSPVTLDVRLAADELDAQVAAGLAISWFIDCCVVLTAGREHPHLRREDNSVRAVAKGEKNRGRCVRYVPTPRFHEAVHALRTGRSTTPRSHLVSGHLRTLPYAHSPSEDAMGRAPDFLRRGMGPRDTFVRGHVRMGFEDNTDELVLRLSSHSLLADALGALRHEVGR